MNIMRSLAARTDGPTLGVVAIAKNERTDIAGFVENLAGWVDEIVVVDDHSTDGTPEYLAGCGYPVVVISRALKVDDDGFGGQRNAGITAATADWLLHMDIDERVPPDLAVEIRGAIRSSEYDAFRYGRLNFFLHRPFEAGGWEAWNAAQLARRGKHHFKNTLHEVVEVEGISARIGQLHAKMWHLNDENFVERLSKNIRYAQMSASRIMHQKRRITWTDLFLRPLYSAAKAYTYGGGWRYGIQGWVFCTQVFAGTFNHYAIAWDCLNRVERQALEQKLRAEWSRGTIDVR